MCIKHVRNFINSYFNMRRFKMVNKAVICVAIIAMAVAAVYLVANYNFSHVKDHMSKAVVKMYHTSLSDVFDGKRGDKELSDDDERNRVYQNRENDKNFIDRDQNFRGNQDSRYPAFADDAEYRRWKNYKIYKERLQNRYDNRDGNRYLNEPYRKKFYPYFGKPYSETERSGRPISGTEERLYNMKNQPGNVYDGGFGQRQKQLDGIPKRPVFGNGEATNEHESVARQHGNDLSTGPKVYSHWNNDQDRSDQDHNGIEKVNNRNNMIESTVQKQTRPHGRFISTEDDVSQLNSDTDSFVKKVEPNVESNGNNNYYQAQNEHRMATRRTEPNNEINKIYQVQNDQRTATHRMLSDTHKAVPDLRSEILSEKNAIDKALDAIGRAQQEPQYIKDHKDEKVTNDGDQADNHMNVDNRKVVDELNPDVDRDHQVIDKYGLNPEVKQDHSVIDRNGLNPAARHGYDLIDRNRFNPDVKQKQNVLDHNGLNPDVGQEHPDVGQEYSAVDKNGSNPDMGQEHSAVDKNGSSLYVDQETMFNQTNHFNNTNNSSSYEAYRKSIAGLSNEEIIQKLKKAKEIAHPFIKQEDRKYADEHKIEIFDWTKPTQDSLHCVDLKMQRGKPKICILDSIDDPLASKSLFYKTFHEQDLLNEMELALSKDPEINLIDIGANIGVYSIAAAQYGRQVLAVEPYHKYLPYFHKSVVLNHFQNQTTLLINAMSNVKQTVQMKLLHDVERIVPVAEFPVIRHLKIPTITLDELVPLVQFKKAILKIDIPIPVSEVLLTSTKFLNRVSVPYIFINWNYVKENEHGGMVASYLRRYKYLPKKKIDGETLDLINQSKWEGEIVFVKT